YTYCIVAENIAYAYQSTGLTREELCKEFIEGRKKSPPHRKNMLDADLFDIGMGVARSSKSGKYYAVQNFGRPRSKEIAFSLPNRADVTVEYALEGKTYSLEPRTTVTHKLCRPSELKLQGSDEGEKFRPDNGVHYVIRKDEAGKWKVGKKE